jgi:hypothetical protein
MHVFTNIGLFARLNQLLKPMLLIEDSRQLLPLNFFIDKTGKGDCQCRFNFH